MSGFKGADVDGLDQTAQKMMDASEAATQVATALQALVVALEAMSWTGFAAALAAYLKGVVIPWVKATAAALKAFGQILQLASSDQKSASGDTPVVTTGSGNYQTPKLPTVSCGEGPKIATVEIRITNGQTGQGAGIQVTQPALPGAIAGSQVGSGVRGEVVSSAPVIAAPRGTGLSTGVSGDGAGNTTLQPAPMPVQVGSGGVDAGSSAGAGASGGGLAGASGGGLAGAGASSGSGSAGSSGSSTGSPSGGWGGSLGISSRPDGGIDVQGSFRGTIGGDPGGASTPAVPASVQGHSSLDGLTQAGKEPGQSGGGLNSALLAAPLGLAGLGAAALGSKGSTAAGAADPDAAPASSSTGSAAGSAAGATGTSPVPGGPDPADESGWRVLASTGSDGQVGLSLVSDTDTVPSALDAGVVGAEEPRIVGWFDGDGDYGFVAKDLVFTTAVGAVRIDSLVLQGNVTDDPAIASAVRSWWSQAITEGGAAALTPATTTPAAVAAAN